MEKEKSQVKRVEYVDRFTGEAHPFRTPYSEYVSSGVDCQAADDDRTEQSHERECNINNIMAHIERTKDLSLLSKSRGVFMDLEKFPKSYQDSLNYVQSVKASFDALPAEVRADYDNNPAKFMQSAVKDPRGTYERAEAKVRKVDVSTVQKGSLVDPEPVKAVVQDPAGKK